MQDNEIREAFKAGAITFFSFKLNLDINDEGDRKKALKWLEKASPNDMFYSEVPDDEVCEFDLISGALRKSAFVDILVKW